MFKYIYHKTSSNYCDISNEHHAISNDQYTDFFVQLFVQANNKENIKDPYSLTLCGIHSDQEIPFTKVNKYSLLMHCIKIKSRAKSLLNEQYVFVGGNISFLCVLSCISEEA